MEGIESVRELLRQKLHNLTEIEAGVFRGERRSDGKKFATAYVDLSDNLIGRWRDLPDFQERILGRDFFGSDGDERWNSYIYFLEGPKSLEEAEFHLAKARIEADRQYARKYVVSAEDLLTRIDGISVSIPEAEVSQDASEKWAELLRKASLSAVLEQPPRTQLLSRIASGDAFVAEAVQRQRVRPPFNDPLGSGLIKSIKAENFRPCLSGKEYSFGRVNLIFGQNGAGKTSLLEAIEALYCGRIRRDAEAEFGSITAEVGVEGGAISKVEAVRGAATIKARNLAWYGRDNPQSGAITHAFTRFNFLDTDAAFRLSNETNAEKIQEDLSLLLVGSDVSALWTYISKLCGEVRAKKIGLDEKIPMFLKQTELLGVEVRRLQDVPSESSALTKSFYSELSKLGAKWIPKDLSASLHESERPRLEGIARGLRQAISLLHDVPANFDGLRRKSLHVVHTLSELRLVAEEYKGLQAKTSNAEADIKTRSRAIEQLERWLEYCEAGAPELAATLLGIRAKISELRRELGGLPASLPAFPPEYASERLLSAKGIAEGNLRLAEQQEQIALEGLSQREKMGRTLEALRQDLRETALLVINHSGDSSRCPVCSTQHIGDELLKKISLLVGADDPRLTDGLRQAVQVARQRAEQERAVLASIRFLQQYAAAKSLDGSQLVGDIRDNLLSAQRVLLSLSSDMERAEAAAANFSALGLELANLENIRFLAAEAVEGEGNIDSISFVKNKIESFKDELRCSIDASSDLKDQMSLAVDRASRLCTEIGISVAQGMSPAEMTAKVGHFSEALDAVLKVITEIDQSLNIPGGVKFEDVLLGVEAAISTFDRAQYTYRLEAEARADLDRKVQELHEAAKDLESASTSRDSFARANEVLSKIVEEFSLDKATEDALEAIRGHVSKIFSRIHSPAEYELGDFHGNSFLVCRKNKEAHGVNQVSTGQRAALALSIFLALNLSARNAPPVMLIDDPVAHIDDLNALAFLDYLRDLAVSQKKQIFFATADARLAALFQRKFDFLGEEQFKKIVLSK